MRTLKSFLSHLPLPPRVMDVNGKSVPVIFKNKGLSGLYKLNAPGDAQKQSDTLVLPIFDI
jgi:hypothetical protein